MSPYIRHPEMKSGGAQGGGGGTAAQRWPREEEGPRMGPRPWQGGGAIDRVPTIPGRRGTVVFRPASRAGFWVAPFQGGGGQGATVTVKPREEVGFTVWVGGTLREEEGEHRRNCKTQGRRGSCRIGWRHPQGGGGGRPPEP